MSKKQIYRLILYNISVEDTHTKETVLNDGMKKDPTKKYTDLCIFIDANIEKLGNAGEYPELEK